MSSLIRGICPRTHSNAYIDKLSDHTSYNIQKYGCLKKLQKHRHCWTNRAVHAISVVYRRISISLFDRNGEIIKDADSTRIMNLLLCLFYQMSLFSNRLEFPNLFDEVGFFVIELFVFRPIRMELGQKVNQFVLIAEKDIEDRFWFVWIGNKNLKI